MSIKTPKLLTIVIPVFNRKEFLIQALGTILNQELNPGWELRVVVVDDGSTDQVEQAVQSSNILKLIRQKNSERGAARNHGARFAIDEWKTDWLLFFDSDDVMVEGALKGFTNRVDGASGDISAVYGRIRAWDGRSETNSRSQKDKWQPEGDLSAFLVKKKVLALGATLIRAQVFQNLGGFLENREIVGSEDFQLLFRVGLSGRILHLPQVTVLYRQHANNTDPTRYLISTDLAIRSLEDVVNKKWPGRQGRKAYSRLRLLGDLCKAGALNSNGYRAEAWKSVRQILKERPQLIFDKRVLRMSLSIARKFLDVRLTLSPGNK